MATFSEPERDIPVVEETDVVVCGAGPAGVCAAIAAARTGARTRLIELHGCLGGVWTAGALSWIIDSADKPGIMAEITGELERRGARATRGPGGKNYAYDVEAMKLLLEEMCVEAGVDVRLHTRVVAAARDGDNRLSVVITESKSGREAWAAKVFVDATGDGDLGALAGCGFDMGSPETGAVQPMSLMAWITGVQFDEIESFVGGSMSEPKQRLFAEMARAGVSPSYAGPTINMVPMPMMLRRLPKRRLKRVQRCISWCVHCGRWVVFGKGYRLWRRGRKLVCVRDDGYMGTMKCRQKICEMVCNTRMRFAMFGLALTCIQQTQIRPRALRRNHINHSLMIFRCVR